MESGAMPAFLSVTEDRSMKTCVDQIKISEIVDGYQVRGNDSVIGRGGKLNITRSCQHEYIRSGDAKWQVPPIQSVYCGHTRSA